MGSSLTELRGHGRSRTPRNRWQEAREAYETPGAGNMHTAALLGGDQSEKRAQTLLSDRAPGLGEFVLCPHSLCEGQPSSPFTPHSKLSSAPPAAWPGFLHLDPTLGHRWHVLAGTTVPSLCKPMVWTCEAFLDSSLPRKATGSVTSELRRDALSHCLVC